MTETTTGRWTRIRESFEPDDQQRGLHEGYWAEIGPNAAPGRPGAWSWDVFESGSVTARAGGSARDERAAKAAVAEWARTDLMVGEIARATLSMAMAAHGITRKAAAAAVIAIAASTAFENEETRSP